MRGDGIERNRNEKELAKKEEKGADCGENLIVLGRTDWITGGAKKVRRELPPAPGMKSWLFRLMKTVAWDVL